jgi:oxygen-independent coproporphyrinogen-3 oxidase
VFDSAGNTFSLYIHIPFCSHKCPYCDFNTYAVGIVPEKQYIAALRAELDFRATEQNWRGKTISTIFFGGGTPSILSAAGIKEIIDSAYGHFDILANAEISLEANPGAIDAKWVEGIAAAGVNRLSLGGQSFESRVLTNLGRKHSPEDIATAVKLAYTTGITNLSLDLMLGTPTQTLGGFKDDLIEATSLPVNHISVYALTVEKGTPFYQSAKRGALKLPREESVIAMMDHVEEFLPAQGLRRYEVSNYAIPGHEAQHNLGYWRGHSYLGIGAGAHTYSDASASGTPFGIRWSNTAPFQGYIDSTLATGAAVSWNETLTVENAIFERLFLGLRTVEGVSLADWKERFGVAPTDVYGSTLNVLSHEGFLTYDTDQNLRLTSAGFRLFDSILEQFASPVIPPVTAQ